MLFAILSEVKSIVASLFCDPLAMLISTCGTCASSFTPHALVSSLSGTGAHGLAKVFAPGQEALASAGSATSFSRGHEKP